MTIREQIIKNLQEGIKELDIFKRVFVWSTKAISSKELPAIDIRDTEDDVEDKNISARHHLKIELTIIAEEAENTRVKLLEYINKTLKKIEELDSDIKLGEYAELLSVDTDIAQENTIFGTAKIEIKALYNSARWEI